jgi:hypothetical protein
MRLPYNGCVTLGTLSRCRAGAPPANLNHPADVDRRYSCAGRSPSCHILNRSPR